MAATVSSLMEKYNLKEEDVNKKVSDLHIDEISRSDCNEWRSLPAQFKMKKIVATDIDRKQIAEHEKRSEFLFKWREQKGSGSTYKELIRAVLNVSGEDEAEGVCKLISSPLSSKPKDSGGNVEADSGGVEETDGRNPTSAKWRDELTKTVQKGQRSKARGLAVVIYNSYENCPGISTLPGAIKDGKAMMDTFKSLQFSVLPIHNATKEDIHEIIREVASYSNYPEEYNCFSIVFAGHGDENSILLAIDGKFDFEKVIVERLNPKVNKSGVSKKIASVPIIAFIDACRGKMRPRARLNERNIPNNMMLCYSTREEDKSFENADGGIWMQKIARELKQQIKPVGQIVASVNKDVKNQNPIYVNTGVDITLKKAIHSEGQRIEDDNSDADETDGIHETSTCLRSWKCTLVSIVVVPLAIIGYFVLYMN